MNSKCIIAGGGGWYNGKIYVYILYLKTIIFYKEHPKLLRRHNETSVWQICILHTLAASSMNTAACSITRCSLPIENKQT